MENIKSKRPDIDALKVCLGGLVLATEYARDTARSCERAPCEKTIDEAMMRFGHLSVIETLVAIAHSELGDELKAANLVLDAANRCHRGVLGAMASIKDSVRQARLMMVTQAAEDELDCLAEKFGCPIDEVSIDAIARHIVDSLNSAPDISSFERDNVKK